MGDIAKKVDLSRSSVWNIFYNHYGKELCRARAKRLEPHRIRKMFEGLIKAGKIGSKPELLFFQLLNQQLDMNIVHHDLDIMPPFEIDITIPECKIAIFWDGIGHQKPIFGDKMFRIVTYRDIQKRKYLESIGWRWFEVIDTKGHRNLGFINKQFSILMDRFPELRGYLK